ncbi:MAG TPA: hypothetical protein VHE34_26860 [Puia sp.]|uniref:hypothetical protein n=1 Tax=Puia sp. TaxID=2045100 RepID=UPI002C16A51A|nr:hypothetical protein [Puia sp.]HVU98884.1 hypothetical protein [Puia sp.]
MAKPIKETPILTGKDACNFVNQISNAPKESISQTELERIKANFEKIKAIVKK